MKTRILASLIFSLALICQASPSWTSQLGGTKNNLVDILQKSPLTPTVATSSTLPNGTKLWPITLGAQTFSIAGGNLVQGFTSDSYTVSPLQYKYTYSVSARSDTKVLGVAVRNYNGYMTLYCNGQLIGTQQAKTDGALGYYYWTFPDGTPRDFHVSLSFGAQIVGLFTESSSYVVPSVAPMSNKIIAVLGDSSFWGVGADSPGTGFIEKASQVLGVNFYSCCNSGTGYILDGATVNYSKRLPLILDLQPNYQIVGVILAGGGNDPSNNPTAQTAGIVQLIQDIHNSLPGVPIWGILPIDVHGSLIFPNQRIAVQNAFQQTGTFYSDPVSPALTSANFSKYVWTSGAAYYHPNQLGQDLLLQWFCSNFLRWAYSL